MGRPALTTEQFIEKAIKVHSDRYDYSKVIYINSKTNVTIVCQKHGEFQQQPSNHLKGWGCLSCSTENRYSSKEVFILEANKVHNDFYDYSNSIYKNAKIPLNIVCPIHGEFEQTPNHHLQGKGCYECGRSKTILSRIYTLEEFITKANNVHNNKYSYKYTNYSRADVEVIITCPEHGDFLQKPVNHLTGRGCLKCAKYGFKKELPAILYYLKVATENNQVLYKVGITNHSVQERFKLNDLNKIEIIKQEEFELGADALNKETEIKRKFKEFQYKGPDILVSNGNTELFTKDILNL